MPTPLIVTFKGYRCVVRRQSYSNGAPALVLLAADTHDSVLIATVNLPPYLPQPGQLFLKTWSENEGVLEALVAGGVVSDTTLRMQAGYAEAAICTLLVDAEVGHLLCR